MTESEKTITSKNEVHPGNAVHPGKLDLPENQYIWEMRYNQETQSTLESSVSEKSILSLSVPNPAPALQAFTRSGETGLAGLTLSHPSASASRVWDYRCWFTDVGSNPSLFPVISDL